MSDILERILDGSIKTTATWHEKTGYHPAVVIELVREHWVWSIVVAIVATVGLLASVKALF